MVKSDTIFPVWYPSGIKCNCIHAYIPELLQAPAIPDTRNINDYASFSYFQIFGSNF